MNRYPAEEVRKMRREYRHAAAKDSAREFVESCPPGAVWIAIARFEKQNGGSFRDPPLLFRQKLEEALTERLSREVYPRVVDAIVQLRELIEAMVERAAFGAFNEAIERARAGFTDIDPSLADLASQTLPPPLKPIDRYPADEIGQIHSARSAAADDEAREFVESHETNALCLAVELFREQSEGSVADLPRLFHQKLQEALSERLSREVYPRATDAIGQTRELLHFLVEHTAVDAFDEAHEAFKRLEECLAGLLWPRR